MPVLARRQVADLLHHRPARLFQDLAPHRLQVGQPEVVHHLHELARTRVVAGGQGVEVAFRHDRISNVCGDEHHERLVTHPLPEQKGDGNAKPFLEQIVGIGPEAPSPDIGDVAGGCKQAYARIFEKDRRDDGKVVQVTGSVPRVVGEQHVSWPQRIDGMTLQEFPYGRGHGVDVTRRAGDRLGQHVAARVEHAGREIAGLPHDRGERGAHQGLGLLLHDGQKPVPDQLGPQLAHIRAHVSLSIRSSTRCPLSVTPAAKPAGTTVVVCSSAITAGPSSQWPGRMSARR